MIKKGGSRTAIASAAQQLRTIALSAENGAFIGREEELIGKLGCSRSTVRQIARLLEREGLLRVKRGISGGYFSARPDAGTIEATVSTYLETLDVNMRDVTLLASTLWVETVRRAALAPKDHIAAVVGKLRKRLNAIKDTASFEEVRNVEMDSQTAIFDLADSAYVKLIFDINVAFSQRRFREPISDDESVEHKEFVPAWRSAKLLELGAIEQGDNELAGLAGQHSRKIWHKRIKSRHAESLNSEARKKGY